MGIQSIYVRQAQTNSFDHSKHCRGSCLTWNHTHGSPSLTQWALNDWPAYLSKIMSNSLPVVLPLQPMALHAVPQTQSDAHFWSCSLGLQYPFFRLSQLPSHLIPGCALMLPSLPWPFNSPTLVYFLHTSHHYSQLFIYMFTSLQSISSEYHISFIRAELLSVWFLDVS